MARNGPVLIDWYADGPHLMKKQLLTAKIKVKETLFPNLFCCLG